MIRTQFGNPHGQLGKLVGQYAQNGRISGWDLETRILVLKGKACVCIKAYKPKK